MGQRRSTTFDEVADLYDAVRPGYPNALVEAVIAVLPHDGRILEIGSGTGQATLPFARRGCSILGLEPGPNVAALATANLSAFPAVTIETVTFEDWPLQERAFDLVMSATAFHWVSPEARYVKTARALKDRGHIALFWNLPPDDDDPVSCDIQSVYERCIPESTQGRRPLEARVQAWADAIEQSGLFGETTVLQFPWSTWYTTAQYLQLLETYSDHHPLPESQKQGLYAGIAEVLDRNGGGLDKQYVAVLFLARRQG